MDIFKITQFNLGDYIQIMVRRKWLFIIPFSVVFLTSTIGSFFLPKVYRATSILLVEDKRLISPLVEGMAVAPTVKERLEIFKEQITSWSRVEEMVKDESLGLAKNIKSEREINHLIQSIRKRIGVNLRGKSIIHISFEDTDPEIAKAVVSRITRDFVQENLYSQTEEAEGAIRFIKDQVEIYRKKLEDAEAALRTFKEKHLLELPGSEGSNLNKAMTIQDALLQVSLDLQEALKSREMLLKQLSQQEKVIISKTTSENPVIQQLNAKLIDLQSQLSDLKARKCTDEHPYVIILKNSIREIEARIQEESTPKTSSEIVEVNPLYQEIASKLHDTEALIDSLRTRQKYLQELKTQYESRAMSVPAQEQEFTRLTRDMDVNESIYAMLLNRLETANISHRLDLAERGTRFKIIDPARLHPFPIKPKKFMIALLGFIIGSILGFGCVFLGEYTDHSLKNLEEAEAFLEIPSLGAISKIVTLEDLTYSQEKRKKIVILTIIATIAILVISIFLSLLIR